MVRKCPQQCLPLVRRSSVSRFPELACNTVIVKAVRQHLIGLSRQVFQVVHSIVEEGFHIDVSRQACRTFALDDADVCG